MQGEAAPGLWGGVIVDGAGRELWVAGMALVRIVPLPASSRIPRTLGSCCREQCLTSSCTMMEVSTHACLSLFLRQLSNQTREHT